MRAWLCCGLVACSGAAGVREHANDQVRALYCDHQSCTSPIEPAHIGDGCYAVRDHLYDCSTDRCVDVTPCAGACEMTVTIDAHPIAVDRCVPRWNAYVAANRPPRRCEPAQVAYVIDPATATPTTSPTTLTLDASVIDEVTRSGKDRVVYTAKCSGGVLESTGFAPLDDAVRAQVATFGLTRCETVSVIVSHFECDRDQVLD